MLSAQLNATVVQPLTFEDLVGQSDHIVEGTISGSTVSWGSEHRYVWTRYRVAVEGAFKGAATKFVTVSEPGGDLDGVSMRIAGAVSYRTGEHVMLFLHRYPNGDERTVGWSQGKITIGDDAGAESLRVRVRAALKSGSRR